MSLNYNDEVPDQSADIEALFGFDLAMKVPAFKSEHSLSAYVPEIDNTYQFNQEVTTSILAGFGHSRRVMIQGFHGTGKSTHIEQVAARLNWPCMRVNLDGNISRIDLIGRDAIVIENGKQITRFRDGIIPWSLRRPVALIFDEYDAARPEVLFVLQRLLEAEGKFTLIDENEVIIPHPGFRLFATANTIGLGDDTGLYHGVQPINQGQMDRWNIVATLNYLPAQEEAKIIKAKAQHLDDDTIAKMIQLADLTRNGFAMGDISTVMSPRTVISWADNYEIFADLEHAFCLTFLNKCDEVERAIIAEYYQRCFGKELLGYSSDEVKVRV